VTASECRVLLAVVPCMEMLLVVHLPSRSGSVKGSVPGTGGVGLRMLFFCLNCRLNCSMS
jgi:hypothetical protein